MDEDYEMAECYYILRDFAMELPTFVLEAYVPKMTSTGIAKMAFADALALKREED